ncbi:MAG: PAS domain S-box protein, partial [Archaeoglobaceae archaeon]|nr:PAS domain S-box protein [Archaeoglobaceae archaeon]MDW8128858.1 PAS domain S-box protein [Archaeoglobaceae archaeon]
MSIIVIKKREDIKDCDLAIVDSEDIELLREAKKHSKLVVFLGEKVEATEELFIMPDGRKLWFESNAITLNLGEKQAILLTLRDVTEKVKLEKKLKESE